jgi:hypothetical protein
MSSSGFEPIPGWYWPEDVPKEGTDEVSNRATSGREKPTPSTSSSADDPARTGQGAQSSRRKYWPPRQCRICLETVEPTYHVPSENLPSFFQSTPTVTYEDEGGRLIRPCSCKGSSKYVHENCLQAWRHADPSYGRRNYWQCPTCGFKYRLARLGWGRFIASAGELIPMPCSNPFNDIDTSTAAQVSLTVLILIVTVFFLGFVADPIINMYLDPWSFLMPWTSSDRYYYEDEESSGWLEHFLKGFTSMGVIGFLKILLASPFSYFRIGGGRGRNTGRDRYEQISWIIIVVGVFTFLVVRMKYPRTNIAGVSNSHRPYGKESEPGAVVLWRKLVRESWTSKRMTMTKKRKKNSNLALEGSFGSGASIITTRPICPSSPLGRAVLIRSPLVHSLSASSLDPHTLKLPWFINIMSISQSCVYETAHDPSVCRTSCAITFSGRGARAIWTSRSAVIVARTI